MHSAPMSAAIQYSEIWIFKVMNGTTKTNITPAITRDSDATPRHATPLSDQCTYYIKYNEHGAWFKHGPARFDRLTNIHKIKTMNAYKD